MAKIVKKTNNQLILRDNSGVFISISLFLIFCCIPTIAVVSLGSHWGVESLKCQRIKTDQVNCTLDKSIFWGLKQLRPESLPLVAQAEHQRYEEVTNDDDDGDCRVIYHHDFKLVFKDKNRYTVFNDRFREGCTIGDQVWIETQVVKLNQFFATQAGTIKISHDNRLLMNAIVMPLVMSLISIGSFLFLLMIPLRTAFHFNKTQREFLYWNTKLLKSKVSVYPFSTIKAVEYVLNIDSDRDVYCIAKLVFNSEVGKTNDLQLGLVAGEKLAEKKLLPMVTIVAKFVGVPLIKVDNRSDSKT